MREAVAVADETATGEKRLLGYVVPEGAFNREGDTGLSP